MGGGEGRWVGGQGNIQTATHHRDIQHYTHTAAKTQGEGGLWGAEQHLEAVRSGQLLPQTLGAGFTGPARPENQTKTAVTEGRTGRKVRAQEGSSD